MIYFLTVMGVIALPYVIPWLFRSPASGCTVFSFINIFDILITVPALSAARPMMILPALIIILAIAAFASGRIKFFWSIELSFLAILLFASIVSVLFSSWPGNSVDMFTTFIWKIFLVTFLTIWTYSSEEDYRTTLYAFVLGGLILCFFAYNQLLAVGLANIDRKYISGIIDEKLTNDANYFSLALLFPFALCLAGSMSNYWSTRKRMIFGILAFIFLGGVVISRSRGGALGTLGVILSLLLLHGHLKRVKVIVLLVVLSIGISNLVLDGRSSDATDNSLDEESIAGRLELWKTGLTMLQNHPLNGVGIGNFTSLQNSYNSNLERLLGGTGFASHSMWISGLAEIGLWALFFPLTLLILIRKLYRTSCGVAKLSLTRLQEKPFTFLMAPACYAGLIGLVISGSFVGLTFGWLQFILLGLAINVAHRMKEFVYQTNPSVVADVRLRARP